MSAINHTILKKTYDEKTSLRIVLSLALSVLVRCFEKFGVENVL